MATDFVGSRGLVRIRSTRTIKNTGRASVEDRYYLSSQDPSERSHEEWINLIRSHWAGVENRNHWRRDASLGEDTARLRNPNAIINLALLRNVALRLASADNSDWLPAQKERLAADQSATLALVRQKL